MSATLTLEIMTPERKRTIEGVVALTIQLTDGSIGIWPGHAPLLAQTIRAPLIYHTATGEGKQILVDRGVLQVQGNRVTMFTLDSELDLGQTPLRLLARCCMQRHE